MPINDTPTGEIVDPNKTAFDERAANLMAGGLAPQTPPTFTPQNLSTANPIQLPQVPTDNTNYAGITAGGNTLAQQLGQANQTPAPPSALDTAISNLAGQAPPPSTADLYESTYGTGPTQAEITAKNEAQLASQTEFDLLNAQMASLNAEAQAVPIQVQKEFEGRGVTAGGVAPIETARLRDIALRSLPLQGQILAAQAKLTNNTRALELAKTKFDKVFELRLADATNQYNFKKDQQDKMFQYLTTKEQQQITARQREEDKAFTLLQNSINNAQNISKQALDAGQGDIAAKITALDPSSPTYQKDLAMLQAKINVPGPKLETSIVDVGGRQLLINNQTGFTIKDLGLSGDGNKKVISDYPDAGILPSDDNTVVQNKLKYSKKYQNETGYTPPTSDTSQTLEQQYPQGSAGLECGFQTHKWTDVPTMGNSYTEKKNTVDKQGVAGSAWKNTAKVGDVLIFDTLQPYGHAAMINSINGDGTVTLSESNWEKTLDANGNKVPKITHDRTISMDDPTIYGKLNGTLKPEFQGTKSGTTTSEIGDVAAEAFGTNNLSDNQKTALDIFNGTGSLSSVSTANNRQSKVAAELAKLKSVAKKTGNIEGILRASAGGKDVDSTFLTSFDKAINVVGQIAELQDLFNQNKAPEKGSLGGDASVDLNPIWGRMRKFNPWDMNAQAITATLQATIPNLARGVYGEVGVLTDNDIANYTKTLPTLTSTEDVRKAVLGITIRSIQRAIENKLKTNANGGRDVSGYVDQYKEIKNIADSLLGEGDNNPLKLNIMNTPSANNPLGIDLRTKS